MSGDPAYGGRVGWELLGCDGPQAVWTEAEQRIGTIR
jgi:hypothetical protein